MGRSTYWSIEGREREDGAVKVFLCVMAGLFTIEIVAKLLCLVTNRPYTVTRLHMGGDIVINMCLLIWAALLILGDNP